MSRHTPSSPPTEVTENAASLAPMICLMVPLIPRRLPLRTAVKLDSAFKLDQRGRSRGTCMLTLLGPNRKCRGQLSRRDVLKVGALGLGGLSLPSVLRLRAHGSSTASRDKSVIMVWLRGGPSHIDSYDMKPDA